MRTRIFFILLSFLSLTPNFAATTDAGIPKPLATRNSDTSPIATTYGDGSEFLQNLKGTTNLLIWNGSSNALEIATRVNTLSCANAVSTHMVPANLGIEVKNIALGASICVKSINGAATGGKVYGSSW